MLFSLEDSSTLSMRYLKASFLLVELLVNFFVKVSFEPNSHITFGGVYLIINVADLAADFIFLSSVARLIIFFVI